MTETATESPNLMRYLADNYEQAQSLRRACEERLRAILQGRDETWGEVGDYEDADEILSAIKGGEIAGPVPMLARSYRRYWKEERDTYQDMMRLWTEHPVHDWLSRVRGIGPTLGCKLLARLDPEKAEYASSFWSYCGLGTVPGARYKCETCGLIKGWPVSFNVSGTHVRLGGRKKCSGSLEKIAGPEDGVRVAQPKASRGEKSSYDRYAKKTMYLVGTSFLKAGGPYEAFYRRERAKAEVDRPGWAAGRKHHLALRKTEKLFLSHLWQVWREALGMPTPDPWAQAHGGHDSKIEPWEMVEG